MFTKITDTHPSIKELLKKIPPHYSLWDPPALLSQKHLTPLLKKLPMLVNAPTDYYQALYQTVLTNFAEWIQGLPAVKSKSFNYHGGFLELAIQRTYLVLSSYRKEYPIKGIKPEQMPAKLALWTYALFTIGLFYGIGEIAATYWITVTDAQGHEGYKWNPFEDVMRNSGSHYRYSFESINRDDLAAKCAPILARQLMPTEGFVWIANDKEIFEYWLRFLQNSTNDTGILAQFILPTHDKLINQDLQVMEKISPYFFEGEHPAEMNEQIDEKEANTEPSKQNKEDSVTQSFPAHRIPGAYIGASLTDLDVTGANTTEIGELFINWLRIGIIGQTISVNRTDSKIGVTQEGLLLLNPDIFKDFLKHNPTIKSTWQEVYNQFLNTGYPLSAQSSRAQQFSQQATTTRQFNLQAQTNKVVSQLKGILLEPTLIFNTRYIPAGLIKAEVAAKASYPLLKEGHHLAAKPTKS